MARYKRRPDGRYYTTIPTGVFDDDGREIRVPVYGRSISEFEANKDAVKAQTLTGSYANDKGATFSQYKWLWFETYIENTEKSHNRKQIYRNTLKNHTGNLDPLKPILQEYTQQLNTLLLFPNSAGSVMSRTQYRRFFGKIKLKINTAAGGKHHYEKDAKGKYKLVYDIDMCHGLSAHVFRHEYATILYYSGIDLLEAIRLFGHSDSKTMTDIYTELRKEESNSKEKLNKYLKEKYS